MCVNMQGPISFRAFLLRQHPGVKIQAVERAQAKEDFNRFINTYCILCAIFQQMLKYAVSVNLHLIETCTQRERKRWAKFIKKWCGSDQRE
jgi:hypothetical protein